MITATSQRVGMIGLGRMGLAISFFSVAVALAWRFAVVSKRVIARVA